MDLTPYVDTVRRDLLQAAALGDDTTRRTAAALAAGIEPSIRLALLNALSELATEVTGALRTVSVETRLDGNDVRVTVTEQDDRDRFGADDGDGARGDRPAEGWPQSVKDAGSELSRTTVRLFQDLKNQAESAATDQGVSLNTYISRAVSDALRTAASERRSGERRRSSGSGRQVSGWTRS